MSVQQYSPVMLTAREEEIARLHDETGNAAEVARTLGVSRGTVTNCLARIKRKREAWDDAPEGQRQAITTAALDPLTARHGWLKTNADGEVTGHSVFWKAPKPQDDINRTVEAIREALADIPKADPIKAPVQDDLCVVFPVADLHIGLLTDKEEVGENWDGKIAQVVFARTFDRLVSVSPGGEIAILAQLGDLMHIDDQRNVTPQNKHQLDADTRYFMVLRRAVSAMKFAIDTLRAKYPRVIYRGCRGNHDIHSSYAVTLALAEHYRGIDGVHIVESAGEFYVHQYGQNMLVLHHGDRAKPERLAHFTAAEWPLIWGRTKHRVAFSGHVHHEVRKEIGGLSFESVGTIVPRDAYAHSHAYSAKRGLVSVSFDREEGEVSRARVGVS